MTATDVITIALGVLLCSLPFLPQVRAPLQRMLHRGYPGSAVQHILQRKPGLPHRCTIFDALLVSATCATATALFFWPSPMIVSLGLGSVLLALLLFDLRYRWLPDALTLPLLPIGVAVASVQAIATDEGSEAFIASILGALAVGGLVWLVGEAFRLRRGIPGIGGGDIKLIAAMGAWFGAHGALLSIGASAILALLVETALQLAQTGQMDEKRRIPFGSYLAAMFWMQWCLKTFM